MAGVIQLRDCGCAAVAGLCQQAVAIQVPRDPARNRVGHHDEIAQRIAGAEFLDAHHAAVAGLRQDAVAVQRADDPARHGIGQHHDVGGLAAGIQFDDGDCAAVAGLRQQAVAVNAADNPAGRAIRHRGQAQGLSLIIQPDERQGAALAGLGDQAQRLRGVNRKDALRRARVNRAAAQPQGFQALIRAGHHLVADAHAVQDQQALQFAGCGEGSGGGQNVSVGVGLDTGAAIAGCQQGPDVPIGLQGCAGRVGQGGGDFLRAPTVNRRAGGVITFRVIQVAGGVKGQRTAGLSDDAEVDRRVIDQVAACIQRAMVNCGIGAARGPEVAAIARFQAPEVVSHAQVGRYFGARGIIPEIFIIPALVIAAVVEVNHPADCGDP